mmetsp:Transcript_18544/g.26099  ORF Transcript_18544/g.26099 Transcript_18544/m.26099 type:complete len:198 (-) Transcript_18544:59-652(-)
MTGKIKLGLDYLVGYKKFRRSIEHKGRRGKIYSNPEPAVASTSEKIRPNEKPFSDTKGRKTKKNVDFNVHVSVRYIEGISGYSDEEKFLTWYTEEDIHEWKFNATSKLHGVPQTEIDDYIRGIEDYQTMDAHMKSCESRKTYIMFLLNCYQKMPCFDVTHKENKDLNLLKLYSESSLDKAQRQGQYDEIIAMEIHMK